MLYLVARVGTSTAFSCPSVYNEYLCISILPKDTLVRFGAAVTVASVKPTENLFAK